MEDRAPRDVTDFLQEDAVASELFMRLKRVNDVRLGLHEEMLGNMRDAAQREDRVLEQEWHAFIKDMLMLGAIGLP